MAGGGWRAGSTSTSSSPAGRPSHRGRTPARPSLGRWRVGRDGEPGAPHGALVFSPQRVVVQRLFAAGEGILGELVRDLLAVARAAAIVGAPEQVAHLEAEPPRLRGMGTGPCRVVPP